MFEMIISLAAARCYACDAKENTYQQIMHQRVALVSGRMLEEYHKLHR